MYRTKKILKPVHNFAIQSMEKIRNSKQAGRKIFVISMARKKRNPQEILHEISFEFLNIKYTNI
jgi:hypothetical protein